MCKYALLTAAYNEEANIERTIQSVLAQTLLPSLWVIVSDSSTDRTEEIVRTYALNHGFIRLVRVERKPGRNFGAKVRALHAGAELLPGVACEYIGNLDADITLEPSYFASLIARFEARPKLGLAAGFVCEEIDGCFKSRTSNRSYSVPHAAQLVRWACYEAIGGYAIMKYGGEDWVAHVSAQMKGWEIEAFPDLKIYHHRHTGEARNLLKHKFEQGRLDHSVGCDPVFQVLKCFARIPEKPVFRGSMARIAGFVWSYIANDERPVSRQFVAFLRNEQRERVRALFSGSWRTNHLQSSHLLPSLDATEDN